MVGDVSGPPELTARGRASRDRIVRAATRLMLEQGVAATSIDDVLSTAGASKSQLYHYFDGKHGLVEAVIGHARQLVFDAQQPFLDTLDGWEAIQAWCDHIVRLNEQRGPELGCPLGTLASELAATDDGARVLLADAFNHWHDRLRAGLTTMLDNGELQPDSNVDDLAAATMASLQGGLLLAKTARSTRPLRVALDAAIAHLRTHRARPRPRRR